MFLLGKLCFIVLSSFWDCPYSSTHGLLATPKLAWWVETWCSSNLVSMITSPFDSASLIPFQGSHLFPLSRTSSRSLPGRILCTQFFSPISNTTLLRNLFLILATMSSLSLNIAVMLTSHRCACLVSMPVCALFSPLGSELVQGRDSIVSHSQRLWVLCLNPGSATFRLVALSKLLTLSRLQYPYLLSGVNDIT